LERSTATGTTFRRAVAMSLLVGAGILTGCERPPQHLVLVSLDTLRADRLSAYGHSRDTSPTLSALAERGVRFDDAISQAIVTPPSHASIFTGKNPPRHGLRQLAGEALADDQTTLAEILRANGFETAAFVSAIPLVADRGLDQGFGIYDASRGIERPAKRTNQRVRKWLATRPVGRAFLWVHYFDPHHPYNPPLPYQQEFLGRPATPEDQADSTNANPELASKAAVGRPDAARAAAMRDLYDGEVRYTDDALSDLFAMLDAAGILSDAIVAVVADHGESLGEHDLFFGHWDVLWENARVPMIVARPDGRFAGMRVREMVRTVDLMPTLLRWLGVDPPLDLDGVDLTALLEGDADAPEWAYTEQHEDVPVRSLRTSDWLLVRRSPEGAPPSVHLYRRSEGREGDEDVADANSAVRDRLAAQLETLYDEGDAVSPVRIPVSEAAREQLRALGYLKDE
jgi:arylsulfatase A-like enzyme